MAIAMRLSTYRLQELLWSWIENDFKLLYLIDSYTKYSMHFTLIYQVAHENDNYRLSCGKNKILWKNFQNRKGDTKQGIVSTVITTFYLLWTNQIHLASSYFYLFISFYNALDLLGIKTSLHIRSCLLGGLDYGGGVSRECVFDYVWLSR